VELLVSGLESEEITHFYDSSGLGSDAGTLLFFIVQRSMARAVEMLSTHYLPLCFSGLCQTQ
jgi:hypothetical protein